MMELLLAMREDLKANTETMNAKMDANTKDTLATLEMADEIKEANRARTKVMEEKRMKANMDACIAD
jgi:hypothetical protein